MLLVNDYYKTEHFKNALNSINIIIYLFFSKQVGNSLE